MRRWRAYGPRRSDGFRGGRSSAHLQVESSSIATVEFACGKSVDVNRIHTLFRVPDPAVSDPPVTLGRYCKLCLREFGIERPRDLSLLGRDHQRAKVYAAEGRIRKRVGMTYFTLLDEARDFVGAVVASPVWRRSFSPVRADQDPGPPRVRKRNGHRFAGHANADEIAIGERGMHRYLVLHELAHTAHRRILPYLDTNVEGEDNTAHGPVFVGILLHLLREFLGDPAAWHVALEEFRREGVEVRHWIPPEQSEDRVPAAASEGGPR